MTVKLNNYSLDPEYIEAGTQGSFGIESLTIEPDATWGGLELSVVFFMPNNTLIKISLPEDNTVPLPQEITLKGGEYRFAVVGVGKDIQKVSVSGTLMVAPSDSFELLEVPVDKISPAFADFLLLYNEMTEIAQQMKVELFFDSETNSLCWRYVGTHEKHTVATLSDLSLSARFDGTSLVVTTPKGELEPVNLKGSSWYCGNSAFTPSETENSVYLVSTSELSDGELATFENINRGDMYVNSSNGDIYRCISCADEAGIIRFERACSVTEFLGAKRIDTGVSPAPETRFFAKSDTVIYLDDNGSDYNDGILSTSPVATLETAISKLPVDGGCVCIVEKYTSDSLVNIQHPNRVVICGLTGESRFETKSVTLFTDASFMNLTIKPLADYIFFNANGYSLAMLNGLTVLPSDNGGILPGIRAGSDSEVYCNTAAVVSIFSGSYSSIYAGGRNTMYGDGVIEIYGNNATFNRIVPCCDGNYNFNGNAYCIINASYADSYINDTGIGTPISCFVVKSSKGGYVCFDRKTGKFILNTPANAVVKPSGGQSYNAVAGIISINANTVVNNVIIWDFSVCKDAILDLATDTKLMLENAPVGSTGKITVTGGLIDNCPKQGLDRNATHEYTVTVRDSGEAWTVREV